MKNIKNVKADVDVNLPVRTVYNQWTQFEEFPLFMEGIEEVRQIDDSTMFWKAKIGGKEEQWHAEITEQIPDKRIAWTNTTGAHNAGVVTFHHIADNVTRVTLQMDYDPEGFIENVGSALGVVERRIKGDLERFKKFVETRGHETGSWRGEIEQEET